MGTFSRTGSPLIYRYLVYNFFIKALIIMFIYIYINIPHVCDLLGLYISLVNNSIDLITRYWLTFKLINQGLIQPN